ncbi:putative acyl-CoA carboxylase beta chain [Rhodococcus wratislaviensis NBRC 100605]|uniref:Putative acyl-CoA carboxylase beta chain n=1 Tax=Rhodococcus wratislaviensis NBRC 100605 TaxID=1219028 RepID=X0QKL5_RHOWR|nr:putative acyl-CoA carboxylase beta chain [Rhodococcus wratislaviensis NBRC 100605]
MFVTGPGVIKSVTGEDVTLDELGGARAQAENGNVPPRRAEQGSSVRLGA